MGPADAAARNLSLTEALELRHLPEEGLRFDEALPADFLRSLIGEDPSGLDLEVATAGRGALEVTPLGQKEGRPAILVRGTISATLRSCCVRCLEELMLEVDARVETTVFPTQGTVEEAADQDLDLEALLAAPDEGTYDEAKGVDLPALIRETLLLEIDMNPACADAGACDLRTAALLAKANAPAVEALGTGDPRWAALRELATPEDGDA